MSILEKLAKDISAAAAKKLSELDNNTATGTAPLNTDVAPSWNEPYTVFDKDPDSFKAPQPPPATDTALLKPTRQKKAIDMSVDRYGLPAGDFLNKRLTNYLTLNPKAFNGNAALPERFARLADRAAARNNTGMSQFMNGLSRQARAMQWTPAQSMSSMVWNDAKKAVGKLRLSPAAKSLGLRSLTTATPLMAKGLAGLDVLDLVQANPHTPTVMASIGKLFGF